MEKLKQTTTMIYTETIVTVVEASTFQEAEEQLAAGKGRGFSRKLEPKIGGPQTIQKSLGTTHADLQAALTRTSQPPKPTS